jgi:hypothetical protein
METTDARCQLDRGSADVSTHHVVRACATTRRGRPGHLPVGDAGGVRQLLQQQHLRFDGELLGLHPFSLRPLAWACGQTLPATVASSARAQRGDDVRPELLEVVLGQPLPVGV